VILLIVVVAAVGGLVLFNDVRYGPHPVSAGDLSLLGLEVSAEVLRDTWGVPHIYASTPHDLFFAQGYVQAQDRWWQMEFFRHVSGGRLGELVGNGQLGVDLYFRTLGFRQAAERDLELMDADTVANLQAFADGINAYLNSRTQDDLALEYTLLGLTGVTITVEPWSPVDTVMWGKFMADNLSGNADLEVVFSALYDQLDEDMVNSFAPPWPFGEKPTILAVSDLALEPVAAALPADTAGVRGLRTALTGGVTSEQFAAVGIDRGPDIGSNNWVAHGSITESGLPLLANDMHLRLDIPSIWYEVGLHCQPVSADCPFDVRGFAFSPSPAVIAGHNARIAWGFTNVGPDSQDLYQIRINPDNDLQYEWNGEWRDITVREEVMRFGDDTPSITIQVRETHLGPIINDNQRADDGTLLGFNNEDPLALRWTALEPGTLFSAVLRLNLATDFDSFREALRGWNVPAQNAVYADVDGNIGYQTPGSIPVRAAGHSGLMPIPGWTDEYEWKGYIPFDDLPYAFNPERGYIQSANQAVAPLEYYDWLRDTLGDDYGADSNYYISQQWDYGYRGQRIDQLLQELAPHSAATFQAIHADNKNLSAAELLPFLADITFTDSDTTAARDWLLGWDYNTGADSPHALLYAHFWARLLDNLYNDQLGDAFSGGQQNAWSTYLLAQEPDNVWWDDINTPDTVETRDDIFQRSFEEAYTRTVADYGADRDAWQWGQAHTITLVNNPLGASGIDLIESIVNRGPFAVSGSSNVVNNLGWNPAAGDFTTSAGPSERVIYDLSDWSNSLSVIPTGQSGHPYHQHYDDQIQLWIGVEYKPMLWTRAEVEANLGSRMVLNAGG
jgi:penicillin amidase